MNIMAIVMAAAVIAVVGIVVGIGLGLFGEKFKVEVDEKELAIREELPGNNCGGCGFAGCDALAKAIANGQAPANACPVGGAPVGEKIASILGVDAGAADKKVPCTPIQESRTAPKPPLFPAAAPRPAATAVWDLVPV